MKFKQKLGYMLIGCLFTIVGYVLALLIGSAIHAQKDEQVIDKIVCKRLEVVNEEGTTAALIGVDARGDGAIEVRNAAGKVVAHITATEEGGGIYVFNEAEIGLPVAGIGVSADGTGTMGVANSRGRRVASLGATKEGSGNIEVLNSAGKDIVTLTATEDGDGVIKSYKGGWRTH